VLTERDAELEALTGLLRDAARGRGGTAVVEGAAGLGKSSLLSGVCERAGDEGLEVLAAAARELDRDLAWSVGRRLLGVGTGLEGFDEALAARARGQPVLVAVDDVHWADVPSLRALVLAGGRAPDRACAVVLAGRDPDDDDRRRLIALAARDRYLRLRPLGPAGAAMVLERATGAASPELVDACLEATGGNAFLLDALARELASRPDARVQDLRPEAAGRWLLARLASLPPEAERLAQALALLGDDGTPRDARRLAGLDHSDGAVALDALTAAGFVLRGRLAHPILRHVLYDSIPPGRRGELHREAAALLAAEGSAPIAHVAAAPPAGSSAAVAMLREAARAAAAGADHAAAARYLRRALDEPPPAGQRTEVLEELGTAEVEAGDSAGFEHLSAALDEATELATRCRIAERLGAALMAGSRPEEGFAVTTRVLREALPVDRERALRLAAVATFAETSERLQDEAAQILREFAVDDPATPGERLLARIRDGIGAQKATPAAVAEALALRAIEGDTEMIGGGFAPWLPAVPLLVSTDHLDEVDAFVERVLEGAAPAFARSYARAMHAWTALWRGDLAAAVARGRATLEIGALFGRPAPMPAGILVRSLALAGRLDEAREVLREAGLDRALPPTVFFLLAAYSRIVVAETAGELETAERELRDFGARQTGRGVTRSTATPWRSALARLLARTGRPEEAIPLVEEELRLAREWGAPRAVAIALRGHGVVHGDAGALAESVGLLRTTPGRLDLADSLVELGALLRRSNRRGDARQALEEAMDLAHDCGAAPLAERARDELRASGARPRRYAASGPEALTGAERRVADLAAQGLTNREIATRLVVSVRTVETHLAHSFAKLDVHRRGELSDALAR
jgi:DNA-binding CsgD family transcriptional regulator